MSQESDLFELIEKTYNVVRDYEILYGNTMIEQLITTMEQYPDASGTVQVEMAKAKARMTPVPAEKRAAMNSALEVMKVKIAVYLCKACADNGGAMPRAVFDRLASLIDALR